MFSGCSCHSWLAKLIEPQETRACPQQFIENHQNLVSEPSIRDDSECSSRGSRSFPWDNLKDDPNERRSLCEAIASNGYAVLGLPVAIQELVATMQPLAAEFFGRPREERCAMGRLRLFKDKVIGYRELGGGAARFLEIHRLAGLDSTIPRPKNPAAMSRVAAKLHAELQGMARDLLTWLAQYIELPPAALLQCIDEASLENLEDGDCSASVLRLGCYGWEADAPEMEDTSSAADVATDDKDDVVFQEHTDASFLTLAPVGSTPGLQMRDSSGHSWVDVEKGLCGQGGHLVVFVGDFLEVLTKGRYVAARHQVVNSPAEAADVSLLGQIDERHRLSMPFLVRGQPSARLNTAPFLDQCPEASLLRLEGMEYAELRRFLDMKGRRRFAGHLVLTPSPSTEAAQKAPA